MGKSSASAPAAALFGVRLGRVQLVKMLDLAFLGVGRPHDAHPGERLPEQGRHAVVVFSQLDADRLQTRVDERQRAPERNGQHDDERRQRPGEEEQGRNVEERDARPLDERQHRVDGERRSVGLDEEDVGEVSARQSVEEIQIRAVEPPEQIVPEPDRNAPLEARRQHERAVEGGVLQCHHQDNGDRDRADIEGRRMPRDHALEPLERTHRRGPLAAEEQVQQRHEEPDAEPLEQHHEESTREHGRQQERLPHEIRAEEGEDLLEFVELLEPSFHRVLCSINRDDKRRKHIHGATDEMVAAVAAFRGIRGRTSQ